MQKAVDSSRGSSTVSLLVDTLKSNYADQTQIYERKIRELNRVSFVYRRESNSNKKS